MSTAGRGPRDGSAFVIFGGTGDLARRKILPALATLRRRGDIDDRTLVLGVTRDEGMTDETYRAMVREAIADDGMSPEEIARWTSTCVFYQSIGAGDAAAFQALAARLQALDEAHALAGNRTFYIALPPAAFTSTIRGLGEAGLSRSRGWTRLVIEKPFGRDVASARALNALVHTCFDEEQVYRIDHYLGKETVQNLLVFRFANAVFESLWSRDHVESVQVTVAESIGLEGRAAYYESAGAIRDILQNHGVQLVTLAAMEVPAMMSATYIRQEKVKVLRSMRSVSPRQVVFGQYVRGACEGEVVPGYREEPGVAPGSNVATYAAVRLEIDNWRWQGVPFLIRTGKRLATRRTELVVKFRRPPVWLFKPLGNPDVHRNTLTLTIQPDEGFALHFHVKAPGKPLRLERLPLDFYYKERFAELPEAYQTLLLDVLEGDQTLFVHAEEVEAAWQLFAPVLDSVEPVAFYQAGSWGPTEAEELAAKAGQRWYNPS
jgi:glucose-6-phosphate 1-dehydrogenase